MKKFVWIDEKIAHAVHLQSATLFGGDDGLHDEGLLHSALARPRQRAVYAPKDDAFCLAASLSHAIIKNHPFIDGNKRTGFVLGVLFLELNGWSFAASEESAAHAVLALAAGKLTEDAYAEFLRDHSKKNR